MNDTDQIRQIATSIIEGCREETAVRQGAELLKLASEIDKQRAESRKLATEEQKISNDLSESKETKKHARMKEYIALLAPLFTTIVLAGTLVQQSYQFVQSEKTKQAQFIQAERDKDAEASRQADAAEDLRWADAVKLLSQSEKLSPAGVILKSFVKSPRYGAPAVQTAIQVLGKTDDPTGFADLFATIFDPVSWNNVAQVLDLDRRLNSDITPLYVKSWNPKTLHNDLTRLSPSERRKYEYLTTDLTFISSRLALVLRGERPPNTRLDLKSVNLFGNFEAADFSGGDITGSVMAEIDVKGANLSGVVGYEGVPFTATAWWRASKIDEGMFQYLIKTYPYDARSTYFPPSTKADYEAGVGRLKLSLQP